MTSGNVEYYFSAGDAVGNQANLPTLAPDFFFDFLVAFAIDDVEVAGDWVGGLPGDTATSGEWEHVDPVGTSAQPDSDHTVDGTMCWVTGQHASGQSDGYNDVDGGFTTLTSPVYDLSRFRTGRGPVLEVVQQYQRRLARHRLVGRDRFQRRRGDLDRPGTHHGIHLGLGSLHFQCHGLFPGTGPAADALRRR